MLGCALPLNRGNEQNVWNPQVVTEACPCVEHRRIFLCSFFTGWIEPANGLLRMQQHSLKKKVGGGGEKECSTTRCPAHLPPGRGSITSISCESASLLPALSWPLCSWNFSRALSGKLGFARGMSRGDLNDGRSADANTHG